MVKWARGFASVGAPLLLVVVASLQLYNGLQRNLSPWKGGGFGMFSTVDAPPLRSIEVRLLSGIGPITVTPPASLQKKLLRATNFPTATNIGRLTTALAELDYSSPYPIAGVPAGDSLLTSGISVGVWRMVFDAAGASIMMSPIVIDSVAYSGAGRWIYAEQVPK